MTETIYRNNMDIGKLQLNTTLTRMPGTPAECENGPSTLNFCLNVISIPIFLEEFQLGQHVPLRTF